MWLFKKKEKEQHYAALDLKNLAKALRELEGSLTDFSERLRKMEIKQDEFQKKIKGYNIPKVKRAVQQVINFLEKT